MPLILTSRRQRQGEEPRPGMNVKGMDEKLQVRLRGVADYKCCWNQLPSVCKTGNCDSLFKVTTA